MKSLKLINTRTDFIVFLAGMDIRFVYDCGTIFILGTGDPEKFRAWMLNNGVKERDVADMGIESVEWNPEDI